MVDSASAVVAAEINRALVQQPIIPPTTESVITVPTPQRKVSPQENLMLMVQRIYDLERDNAALRYSLEHPNYDAEESWEQCFDALEQQLNNGEASVYDFGNRFNYDFFKSDYHPDFVIQLVTYLCDKYTRLNVECPSLWTDLRATGGLLSQDLMDSYDAGIALRELDEY
jgi:hypothetical protein